MDWVVFPGNPEPLKLFTIDVVTDCFESDVNVYMTSKDKQIKRMRDRMERNQLREKAFSGQFEIASLFDTHDELKEMIAPFSMDFRI